MNTTPTPRHVRDPRWVREALYYADRPSRSSDDVETIIAGVMLDAQGGRRMADPLWDDERLQRRRHAGHQ